MVCLAAQTPNISPIDIRNTHSQRTISAGGRKNSLCCVNANGGSIFFSLEIQLLLLLSSTVIKMPSLGEREKIRIKRWREKERKEKA